MRPKGCVEVCNSEPDTGGEMVEFNIQQLLYNFFILTWIWHNIRPLIRGVRMKKNLIAAAAMCFLFAACGAPAEKVEITLELAQQYLSEGRYEEAVEAFTALIEIDPKNEVLYMGRADAYTYLEQYPEATGDYSTVVTLNDANTEAYIYRGVLNYVQGDSKAGEEDLNKVSQLTSEQGNDDALAAIAGYLERLNITPESEDTMDGASRKIYAMPDGSHLIILKMDGQPFGVFTAAPGEEIATDLHDNLLTAFTWKNMEPEFSDMLDMLDFREGGLLHGVFAGEETDRAYMAGEQGEYFIADGAAEIEPGSTWDPYGYYYANPEPNMMVAMGYSEYACNFYTQEGKLYLLVNGFYFGGGFLFEPYMGNE